MNMKTTSKMMILGFSESQRINLMKRHKDISSTVLGNLATNILDPVLCLPNLHGDIKLLLYWALIPIYIKDEELE